MQQADAQRSVKHYVCWRPQPKEGFSSRGRQRILFSVEGASATQKKKALMRQVTHIFFLPFAWTFHLRTMWAHEPTANFALGQGNMELPTVQRGKRKLVEIKEGQVFLLKSNIPHSPQRPEAGSLGLVVERSRYAGRDDALSVTSTPARFDSDRPCECLASYF
jgi:hypothetical protein